MASSQLTLPFTHDPSWQRSDFIIGEANRLAVQTIDSWPDGWPARILLLSGPAGSGKTHLAAIWARTANAVILDADHPDPFALDQYGRGAAFVLEMARPQIDEQALFHILNRINERRQWLLLTARAGAHAWEVTLADLRSRLTSAPSVALGEPDDALLEAILFKLFTDLRMEIEAATLRFLVTRMERTPAAAGRLAKRIDELALVEKRRMVTKMLASRALAVENRNMDER